VSTITVANPPSRQHPPGDLVRRAASLPSEARIFGMWRAVLSRCTADQLAERALALLPGPPQQAGDVGC